MKDYMSRIVTKGNILLLFAIVFYFIADCRISPLLHLAFSYVAAILISSYIYSLYLRLSLRKISLARHFPREVTEDERVEVNIVVENKGLLSQYSFEIIDYIETPEGKLANSIFISQIPGRGKVKEQYSFTPTMRGRYKFGTIAIKSSFPLGIFSTTLYLNLNDEIIVFPRALELPHLKLSGQSLISDSPSNLLFGEMHDFLGIREYRPKDRMNMVHWPSTARQGRLIVKEYDFSLSSDTMILMDLNKNSNTGYGKESTLEYSVKISAALANHILTHWGGRVAFMGKGKKEYFLPKGKGSAHLKRILTILADVKADGEISFYNLLLEAEKEAQPFTTFIGIFPSKELSWNNYIGPISALKAKNIALKAILVDHLSFYKDSRANRKELYEAPYPLFSKMVIITQGDSLREKLCTIRS